MTLWVGVQPDIGGVGTKVGLMAIVTLDISPGWQFQH